MRFFKATILTASVVAFALGGITLASAAPFGSAALGKIDAGTNVIQVQGAGGGAPPGNPPAGTPPAQGQGQGQGNKQGGNQAKGGGAPGKGGNGNNHNGRNGAIAAGVLGGIIGGIIATQPRGQPEPVYEEDDEGPRYRCRYGSYIGRDGYRHCRQ